LELIKESAYSSFHKFLKEFTLFELPCVPFGLIHCPKKVFSFFTVHTLATKRHNLLARHQVWPKAHASILLQYHLQK